MKTATTDLLKKELLLVELPEDTQFDVLVNNPFWKDGIKFLTGKDEKFHFIKGSYTLLGKPDEIREEDVEDLVEQSIHTGLFAHYVKDIPVNTYCYKTAKESLLSALESEVYWENPLNNKLDKSKPLIIQTEHLNKWKEAQEKTFDRNRTLIFVKN